MFTAISSASSVSLTWISSTSNLGVVGLSSDPTSSALIRVFDVEVRLTGRLVDEDGEVMAEDSVVVVPRCVDNDQQEFCRQICAG